MEMQLHEGELLAAEEDLSSFITFFRAHLPRVAGNQFRMGAALVLNLEAELSQLVGSNHVRDVDGRLAGAVALRILIIPVRLAIVPRGSKR